MKNLTFSEAGLVLMAVGKIMFDDGGLSAGAALDGNSDNEIRETLIQNGVDDERADEILENIDILLFKSV